MAVPSVIRLLPLGASLGSDVFGPSSGNALVEIYGSGFRVSGSIEQATPNEFRDFVRTVSVTFDGVEALEVMPIRSNLLRVVTPPGVGTVDVVVTNLDDNGDPIPGETVTFPASYEYRRPDLTSASSPLPDQVIRTLIQNWRTAVHENTLVGKHTDYDGDTADGLNIVDIATLPALVFTGPQFQKENVRSIMGSSSLDNGQYVRSRVTRNLVFDVVGMTDSYAQTVKLLNASLDYLKRTPWIDVNGERFDQYLEGTPSMRPGRNNSNLQTFTMQLVVAGIDLAVETTEGDLVIEVNAPVEEICLDSERLDD